MRRVARLNPDQTPRQLLEERQDAAPSQFSSHNHIASYIDPMHLEHRFSESNQWS
jgi:hypothetical protein